jgi:hypothetical protein
MVGSRRHCPTRRAGSQPRSRRRGAGCQRGPGRALFILTVFYRDTSWGQGALVAVLILMVVVFWRRFRRVHRAFKGQEDDT